MLDRRQVLKLGFATLASSCFSTASANKSDDQASAAWLKVQHAIRQQAKKSDTLTLLYPKGSYDNIQVIITDFERQYGVKVLAKEAALDDIASEMLLQQRLNKNYFDVALPPTFSIPNLAQAQVITDLTDLAAEHEPQGYFDSSLYQVGDRFLGRLYGYQADGDAYMMFYNQSFINDTDNQKRYEDRYQTKLTLPHNWTALDQQIRFFHQPEKEQYGGSLFRNKNYMVWEFWIRMHARGLYPVKHDMTPLINAPEAIEELEKMVNLNQYLEPGVHQNGLFENFASFAKGNKFCNIGWGGTQKYMVANNSPIKNRLAWSPTLAYNHQNKMPYMPFFNWGWNYVVSNKSKQKELAYLFCLFASSVTNSSKSVKQAGGYFDPHRTEHYHDSDIVDLYGNDFLNAHATSLNNSVPDFYMQGQAQYMSALRQGVFNASQGRMTAKRALDLVAQHWVKLTDQLGKKQQVEQWQSLSQSYPDFFKKMAKVK